jgi:hypothetical protein
MAGRVTVRLPTPNCAAKDQVNAFNAMLCDEPGDVGMRLDRSRENRLQGSRTYTGIAKSYCRKGSNVSNVPTPGTPVRLATEYTPSCHIRVQVIVGLTGTSRIG